MAGRKYQVFLSELPLFSLPELQQGILALRRTIRLWNLSGISEYVFVMQTLTLRKKTAGDDAFLRQFYASMRAEEMAFLPLSAFIN